MSSRSLPIRYTSVSIATLVLFLAASGAWLMAQSEQPAGGEKTGAKSEEPQPTRIPTPEEIQKALAEKGGRGASRVVLPVDRRPGGQAEVNVPELTPNNIRTGPARLLPEGTRIVDRVGRLARDGGHWTYAFESRGEGQAELPMRLLPNSNLEIMETFTDGGEKPVVFRVSGEITEYRGVNYLLVQTLLTQTDMGNLQ